MGRKMDEEGKDGIGEGRMERKKRGEERKVKER